MLCKQPLPLAVGAIVGSYGKWEGLLTECIAELLTVLLSISGYSADWMYLVPHLKLISGFASLRIFFLFSASCVTRG